MEDEISVLMRILNGDEKPKDLSLSLLKSITNDFYEERKIGEGGFGEVFKGEVGNKIVAVKRMYVNEHTVDDRSFRREINSLMNTNHLNVVRFFGYCSNTYHKSIKEPSSDELNFVNVNERLLCSEFISNGSLDKHITDELQGLEWETRYAIITGICKGMHYLHEDLNIIHMDLKPHNILLDDHMVPKITDFGLSRSSKISRTMGIRFGTEGYFSPEYESSGRTSFECDIFSLGAIISQLVTGFMGVPNKNNVLERWTERWKQPPTPLQYQQITRCIDIAVRCREHEPKSRPSIKEIMGLVNESTDEHSVQEKTDSGELQQAFAHMAVGETSSMVSRETTELLDIHPMELRFPFVPNTLITCPLYLTNRRDHHVAFRLEPQGQETAKRYHHKWLCGTVPPRTTYTLNVTMKERSKPSAPDRDEYLIILSTVISGGKLDQITQEKQLDIPFYNFFSEVKQKGIDKVHELKLKAVCDPQGQTTTKIITLTKYNKISSMDVHPTEPLIITSRSTGHFRIWNYDTMSLVYKITKEEKALARDVLAAKFVVRKKWIVVGDGDGCIHVYDSRTMKKEKSLKTHRVHITCLAVHATNPYVLATSNNWEIEMWDWEKGLMSARTFKGHKGSVYQIAFNPKNANSFATVSQDMKVKIWSLDSPDHITLEGHTSKVRCLDYFGHADKQYLITGSDDGTAMIWNLQNMSCIKTLEGHKKRVSTVCSHPLLPLLMTGSLDGTVRLWDSNTFRLKGILNFGLEEVHALVRIMEGSGRVAIGYSNGLAILAHEDVVVSSENTM